MIEFLKQTFGEAATDGVIESFKAQLGKKFVAKADYNAKRDELKNIQAEMEDLKLQWETEKTKAAQADELGTKLSELQARYDEHVSVLNGKLEKVQLENQVNSMIRKSGGKNEKALRALLDLNGENPIDGVGQQLEALKLSDPYLFDSPSPGGTKGNFPRSECAKGAPLTYSQMMQLNNFNGGNI